MSAVRVVVADGYEAQLLGPEVEGEPEQLGSQQKPFGQQTLVVDWPQMLSGQQTRVVVRQLMDVGQHPVGVVVEGPKVVEQLERLGLLSLQQ